MHLIETYATYCGSKIDKPFIYESFFPAPFEKYITFHSDTPYTSRNYDYWQEVIDLISPYLEKNNIKLIQIGGEKDRNFKNCENFKGKTNRNQLAYVLRKSLLHFGADSFPIHLAGFFDINLVALYSISRPENAGPYFGTKEKQILFKGYEKLNLKPSYSPEENPKTINSIFPEEIACAVLKLLNIEHNIEYKTVEIGERYGKLELHDFIANQVVNVLNKDSILDIRMDYHFSEEALAQQLQLNKCRIFTNKRINLNILKNFKQAIDQVFYIVNENDDPSFIKDIIDLGIKFILLSELPQELINKKKINYYDYGNINPLPKTSPDLINKLKNIKNLYYKSCHHVYSLEKIYSSFAAQKSNTPKTGGFEQVIDSDEFWKESQNFYFVEMLDKN
jgi:hypothetical protein